MIEAGMNVARLNFSHGDFADHEKIIGNIRGAAGIAGRRIAIMADLPSPKMRIGKLVAEPVELRAGDSFTLTTERIIGDDRQPPDGDLVLLTAGPSQKHPDTNYRMEIVELYRG